MGWAGPVAVQEEERQERERLGKDWVERQEKIKCMSTFTFHSRDFRFRSKFVG